MIMMNIRLISLFIGPRSDHSLCLSVAEYAEFAEYAEYAQYAEYAEYVEYSECRI